MQLKFFLLISTVVAVRAATVANILTDLDKVKTQATNLANAINAFGGNLGDALTIHTQVASTKSAIDTTNTDAKTLNAPVSEADGQKVLSAIKDMAPIVTGGLQAIITKKASFQTLSIGNAIGLVKQDLTNLRASTSALETTLVSKTPVRVLLIDFDDSHWLPLLLKADLISQANDIKSSIDSAFGSAIAAYS